MTIVNRSVPLALRTLGYSEPQIEQIEAYINEKGTIVGAPGLKDEHLPVFDVAVGERAISHTGHIEMMAATQPFLSGRDLEDGQPAADGDGRGHRRRLHARAGRAASRRWRSTATARRRRRRCAPTPRTKTRRRPRPTRRRRCARMPRERESITHKFSIAGHEGYITAGKYEDGSVGEIFLTDIGKEGSTLRGHDERLRDGDLDRPPVRRAARDLRAASSATCASSRRGSPTNPEIPFAKSMPDYIMRWLASRFIDDPDDARGPRHPHPGGAGAQGGAAGDASRDDTAAPANGRQRATAATATPRPTAPAGRSRSPPPRR